MPALMGNDFQRKLLDRQGFALTFGRGELVGFSPEILKPDCVSTRCLRKFKRPVFVLRMSRIAERTKAIQEEAKKRGMNQDGMIFLKMGSRMTSSWLFFSCCTSWCLGLGHFSGIISPKPMEMTQSLAQFIPNAAIFALFIRVVLATCCYLLSILYCLAALFNGSNFKSLRTGKIDSAYREHTIFFKSLTSWHTGILFFFLNHQPPQVDFCGTRLLMQVSRRTPVLQLLPWWPTRTWSWPPRPWPWHQPQAYHRCRWPHWRGS